MWWTEPECLSDQFTAWKCAVCLEEATLLLICLLGFNSYAELAFQINL